MDSTPEHFSEILTSLVDGLGLQALRVARWARRGRA